MYENRTVHGLWRLDGQSLIELENIIASWMKDKERQRKRLVAEMKRKEREKIIGNKTLKQLSTQELQDVEHRVKRAVAYRVSLMDESKLEYTVTYYSNGVQKHPTFASVADIQASSELENVDVNQIAVEVQTHLPRVTIRLPESSELFGGDISIACSMYDYPREASELIEAVSSWACQKRCPWWQYRVVQLRLVVAFISLLWLVFMFTVLVAVVNPASIEAERILAEGVTDSNRNQAIEALLALQTRKPLKDRPLEVRSGNWQNVALATLSICVVLFLVPSGDYEVGRGKGRMRRSVAYQGIYKWLIICVLLASIVGIMNNWFYDKIKHLLP